ncbi:glutathione transferase GstA [Vibrio porteresiae]|uniref:Glutathione transferase GstA n=1 Tax=Vibrio porteresiae DSM 19223 TaxID=1123496 RepID=A0ABZ0QF18_9VIBR|nr:glutathione transferase GstA [Vibrio porteresiae]WPC75004.1 glutathione transferase GstA [Vibrio porteresiae DSM 19223]
MKLYFTPGACSLAPHIVLEELGLSHELDKVDLKAKKTQSGADFLALNAKGYVPALQLDNGHILTEGLVISQYLADQKPEAGLIPAAGEERYQLQSLMVFISTELHKPMGSMFNPAQSADARQAAEATLTKRLGWIVEQLGDNDYLFANQFSIADAYLFTVLNWANIVKFDLTPWPTLAAFSARVAQRPAVQAALKAEGLI